MNKQAHLFIRAGFLLPFLALSAFSVAVALGVLAAPISAAENTAYETTLRGSSEVPPISATSTATTTGDGVFTIGTSTSSSSASTSIAYTLSAVSNSPVTGAHLHCAAVGDNGPIVAPLFSSTTGATNNASTSSSTTVFSGLLSQGSISSSSLATTSSQCSPGIYDTEDLVAAIRAGTIYANIHTLAYPQGAARGQLTTTGATSSSTSTPPTATSTATSTQPVTIEVVKHFCPSISSAQEFNALASTSTSTTDSFLKGLVACPVISRSNSHDAPSGAIAGTSTPFEFTLRNASSTHEQYSLKNDASFRPSKLCEADVSRDINGDGQISSSTCYSTSSYRFPRLWHSATSTLIVRESRSPEGSHFGTVLFTPTSIAANNDAQSLVSTDTASGTITVRASQDTDGMIMLHVYNFADATSTSATSTTSTTTATTTPPVTGTGTSSSATSSTISIQRLSDLLARIEELRAQLLQIIGRLRVTFAR